MSGIFTEPTVDAPKPRPLVRPSTTGETLGASWRLSLDDDDAGNENNRVQAYNGVEDALVGLGYDRKRYQNPAWNTFLTTTETSPERRAALWSDVQAARAKNPKYFTDLPKTQPEFDKYAYSRGGNRAEDQATVSRGSGVAATGASIGFGILQSGQPQNLPGLIMGGAAKTIPQVIARGFLSNSIAAIPQVIDTAQSRANMGEEYTAGEALKDVALQGVIGAGLDVGIHSGGKVLAPIINKVGPAVSAVIDPLRSIDGQIARGRAKGDLADAADAEIASHFAKAVPADMRTADEHAAVNVIERQADVDASNPYVATPVGMNAHAAQLQAAIDAVTQSGRGGPALDNGTPLATLRPATPSPAGVAAPMSQADTIRFTMHDLEGGAAVVHFSAADGGTTKFGIAATHNPGVDVANLSEGQAVDIAKRKYWFRELDSASPDTAAVAFDAGYIAGPATGRRILRESGGDPARAIELYRAYLNHLADTVPGKEKFRKGWNNRIDKLQRKIGAVGGDDVPAFAGGADAEGAVRDPDQDAARPEIAGAGEQSGFHADSHAADLPQLRRELHPDDAVHADAQALSDRNILGLDHPATVAEPARAVAQDAGRPASIAASPEDVAALHAQLRDLLATGHSVAPDKIAQSLSIDPETARGMLAQAAGDPANRLTVSNSGAIRRIPQRRGPVDLLTFIADEGGILLPRKAKNGSAFGGWESLRDQSVGRHDLIKGRNLQRMISGSGPLFRKGGRTLDELGERLHEAGWFPENARPSEDDVLQLLERASREKVFHLDDEAHVAEQAHDADRTEQRDRAGNEIADVFEASNTKYDDSMLERAIDHRIDGLDPHDAAIAAINDQLEDDLARSAIEADKAAYDFDTQPADAIGGENRGPDGSDAGHVDQSGDPGPSEADAGSSDGDTSAYRDEVEAERPTPPDLEALSAFDDPVGPAAIAVADSIEHDLKAALDKGAKVDPAIAARDLEKARLKADAPLRSKSEQDGTMGSPLFDAADQPTFRLDDGDDRSTADILSEIDADEAAIAAAKACM